MNSSTVPRRDLQAPIERVRGQLDEKSTSNGFLLVFDRLEENGGHDGDKLHGSRFAQCALFAIPSGAFEK